MAIRESVVALARVALARGTLVFGGHPAISPLILMVATQLGAVARVKIHQSSFFRKLVPVESLAFPHIEWTSAGVDRERSLLSMRKRMLTGHNFSSAVFIGGMEGVEEEHRLFRSIHPQLPAYPVASTGAAARLIFDAHPAEPADKTIRAMLGVDLVYDAVFRALPAVS
jgi:hypothetical protein